MSKSAICVIAQIGKDALHSLHSGEDIYIQYVPHEIRDTRNSKGFVSIRVPMPFIRSFPYYTPFELVWINVCKDTAGESW